MGKDQKADMVWDEKYDSSVKDSSELTIYQISNLKYTIEFDKFSFDNTINDTANQYLEIYTSSSTSTTTNPPIETITTTTTKYRKQEVNVETLDELKKAISEALKEEND